MLKVLLPKAVEAAHPTVPDAAIKMASPYLCTSMPETIYQTICYGKHVFSSERYNWTMLVGQTAIDQ